MRRIWAFYKLLCILIVTLALVLGGALYGFGAISGLLAQPAADSVSPDHVFQIRVYAAGQGDIPPDYRADVSFYLYNPARWPLFRSTLIARAALADGWSISWAGPRDATISAGRLSWFDKTVAKADGVAVHVVIANRAAGEADCIGQSFANAIDGITCFDGLLGRLSPPPP